MSIWLSLVKYKKNSRNSIIAENVMCAASTAKKIDAVLFWGEQSTDGQLIRVVWKV